MAGSSSKELLRAVLAAMVNIWPQRRCKACASAARVFQHAHCRMRHQLMVAGSLEKFWAGKVRQQVHATIASMQFPPSSLQVIYIAGGPGRCDNAFDKHDRQIQKFDRTICGTQHGTTVMEQGQPTTTPCARISLLAGLAAIRRCLKKTRWLHAQLLQSHCQKNIGRHGVSKCFNFKSSDEHYFAIRIRRNIKLTNDSEKNYGDPKIWAQQDLQPRPEPGKSVSVEFAGICGGSYVTVKREIGIPEGFTDIVVGGKVVVKIAPDCQCANF